ncbi:XdhC family protein [Oceanobacter mangrovi]|uniref:XdhC family protein n=1 Tax=Oceanobacter mangrovi TaxID=2862510 RepID=UPI001C8DAB7E|nr:XdhC family protein [Oceanobacter mangrovi]
MQYLDTEVVQQALAWSREGHTVWLCTVLATFGSSPRDPGSMMVARQDGQQLGSLSGGCVEEDFLEQLQAGAFSQPWQRVRYGAGACPPKNPVMDPAMLLRPQLQLPCGGILDVLVERLPANESGQQRLQQLLACLHGETPGPQLRTLSLADGRWQFSALTGCQGGDRVQQNDQQIAIRVGPSSRLIIAGLSSVARICAEFAVALGYEVIVCEPRPEQYQNFQLTGVQLIQQMPSRFIAAQGNVHGQTAIVAMTHDPRIDDLAMIEAVKTGAFYVGVMGSRRTSDARATRLMRSGGLTAAQLERIHMPIGLALGSKTPAEIALAIMADILRTQRGRERHDL